MSEPPCDCPGPGFCPRYQIEQGPLAYGFCRGTRCSPERSQRFRDKLAGKRTALPVVARPRRKKLELRPVCRWQGAEVPGCKTCGGAGSVLYYCESPDDDADRCVRGRSKDPAVRSCLDCPHYSGTSNDSTDGTPEMSR